MHKRRLELLNKHGFVADHAELQSDVHEDGEYYKVGVSGQAMLSEAEARFYMIELLLALEEIHSFSLVYRDLKPDNILIDEQGHISVSDFGLCGNLLEEHDGRLQGNCGTKGYIGKIE
jgi:serine/threonine protein kinase